jgi:hypothetical protein
MRRPISTLLQRGLTIREWLSYTQGLANAVRRLYSSSLSCHVAYKDRRIWAALKPSSSTASLSRERPNDHIRSRPIPSAHQAQYIDWKCYLSEWRCNLHQLLFCMPELIHRAAIISWTYVSRYRVRHALSISRTASGPRKGRVGHLIDSEISRSASLLKARLRQIRRATCRFRALQGRSP